MLDYVETLRMEDSDQAKWMEEECWSKREPI